MLKEEDIQKAEQVAKEVIINSFGSIDAIELPIDLNVILENYALTLKKGMFAKDDISGAFDRNSSTIYISNKESPERQAFTVAHEIGHYMLHAEIDTELFYRNTWQLNNPGLEAQEQMANWFAASLLMPEEAIKRLWKTTKNVEDLSSIFGVSKSAMYYRLRNLHLL
jgi:Zn-dependent peptidase ImmA (M78 family)